MAPTTMTCRTISRRLIVGVLAIIAAPIVTLVASRTFQAPAFTGSTQAPEQTLSLWYSPACCRSSARASGDDGA